MSHAVIIPDDFYARIVTAATVRGLSVDAFLTDLLARELPDSPSAEHLNWSTASAEEIIADLRASRVERERPVEL
ncbi:MAG TPA: hypothetical protein VKT52_08100 [Ktedonobacterales bacterium]|nr:hypothetical protein [Ktedonobacterales bacterium]